MTIDWQLLDAVIQWIIIPGFVWMWHLHNRVTSGEKAVAEKFGTQDKEIVRLLTIIEEREKSRAQIRAGESATLNELHLAIKDMNDRLDKLGEAIAHIQGRQDK